MWLWDVDQFSVALCLDFSHLNVSPQWNKTLLSLNLWPFQCRKWSGRLVPLFHRYNRVPVFGFTCHHVCWGPVHPRSLKTVCNPCSVWYVRGSRAGALLMSIGLQISFRLNLISAWCFSFWCDGWDYRCSRWRLSPACASDPSPHFFFPAYYPPGMNSAADVCLFIDSKAVLWLAKPLPGFSTLRWREGKGFTEAAVKQQDPVFFIYFFPKKEVVLFPGQFRVSRLAKTLLHTSSWGSCHCSSQRLKNDANTC